MRHYATFSDEAGGIVLACGASVFSDAAKRLYLEASHYTYDADSVGCEACKAAILDQPEYLLRIARQAQEVFWLEMRTLLDKDLDFVTGQQIINSAKVLASQIEVVRFLRAYVGNDPERRHQWLVDRLITMPTDSRAVRDIATALYQRGVDD